MAAPLEQTPTKTKGGPYQDRPRSPGRPEAAGQVPLREGSSVSDLGRAHLAGSPDVGQGTVEARKLEYDCPPILKPREEGKPA